MGEGGGGGGTVGGRAGAGRRGTGIPTRISLINRTLKISEKGKVKQCFDVESCSSLQTTFVW